MKTIAALMMIALAGCDFGPPQNEHPAVTHCRIIAGMAQGLNSASVFPQCLDYYRRTGRLP